MGTYKAADGNEYDTYRWALVLHPITVTLSVMKKENVPLRPHRIKVIFENLDWNQIEWGADFVKVNQIEYKIEKLFWVPISKQKQKPPSSHLTEVSSLPTTSTTTSTATTTITNTFNNNNKFQLNNPNTVPLPSPPPPAATILNPSFTPKFGATR
jgi:hypothetical protein